MATLECRLCGTKLRKDIALIDSKWESINNYNICRDCVKKVMQLVVDEY